MRRVAPAAAALLVASAALAGVAAGAERAGRMIYERGESPSGGTIRARVGMSAAWIPGAAVACGNCHGEDGLGRAEGGVRPANIRWSELTKPYEREHDSGRRNGPYDERLLRRALMAGIDSAGNRLDPAMPRYEMSESDLAALTAYLRVLERSADPGVGEAALRIGTLLPLEGRFGAAGRAIRGALEAHFDAVNAGGGLHGRKLQLVVRPLPEAPAAAAEAARRLIEEGEVFALLAPVSARIERELTLAAEAARIPVIGPVTLYPEDLQAASPVVFHVLGGVPELAQVLAAHEAARPGALREPLALLHAQGAGGEALAGAVAHRLQELGYAAVLRVAFESGAQGTQLAALAEVLARGGVAQVLLLGAGLDVSALARATAAIGRAPRWLIPGPLAPRDVLEWPAAYRGRVLLAYPALPQEGAPAARRAYAELAASRSLERGHQPMQVAAYSAAQLLAEGLKRAGRDLSRRKLIAALETVQDYDLGLVPPVSYNANRRIGAPGGQVVMADLESKQYRPLGGFVRLP